MHETDRAQYHCPETVVSRTIEEPPRTFAFCFLGAFDNKEEKALKIQQYLAAGNAKVAQALEAEFFWWIDVAVADLAGVGFQVETRRFSDLSFGIVETKVT